MNNLSQSSVKQGTVCLCVFRGEGVSLCACDLLCMCVYSKWNEMVNQYQY